MDAETCKALVVFASAFGVSAFAGLTAQLRIGRVINKLTVFGAPLNSGLLGLAIALFWYNKFQHDGNVYALIGICILSGLGGSTITDFVVYVLRKGGVSIQISHHGDAEDSDHVLPAPKRRKR